MGKCFRVLYLSLVWVSGICHNLLDLLDCQKKNGKSLSWRNTILCPPRPARPSLSPPLSAKLPACYILSSPLVSSLCSVSLVPLPLLPCVLLALRLSYFSFWASFLVVTRCRCFCFRGRRLFPRATLSLRRYAFFRCLVGHQMFESVLRGM